MKVKEMFKALGATLKSCGKKIVTAFLNAKPATIGKIGLFVGAGVAGVALLLKFLKDKRRMYKNAKKSTATSEAVNVNYNNSEKAEELHPAMKKIKERLRKGIKPRKVRSSKRRNAKKSEERFKRPSMDDFDLERELRFFNMYREVDMAVDYDDEGEDDQDLVYLWRYGL